MTKGFIRQPGYNDTIICLGSSNDFFIDENALFFGWSMMVFLTGSIMLDLYYLLICFRCTTVKKRNLQAHSIIVSFLFFFFFLKEGFCKIHIKRSHEWPNGLMAFLPFCRFYFPDLIHRSWFFKKNKKITSLMQFIIREFVVPYINMKWSFC